MDRQALFHDDLDLLHELVNSDDPLEVRRAAPIVRRLLLDGNRLLDQVNRELRTKLTFPVAPRRFVELPRTEDGNALCAIGDFDPYSRPNATVSDLTRDQFLSLPLGEANGVTYRAKHVVEYVASVMGGVHAGSPRSDEDWLLETLSTVDIKGELAVPLLQMRSIGRAVLVGLRDFKFELMGLDEFVESPGISIHLALAPREITGYRRNYLFTVGSGDGEGQVSVFIDEVGRLALEYLDSRGELFSATAGRLDRAFTYGQVGSMSFEVGSHDGRLMLLLESGGWFWVGIVDGEEFAMDGLACLLGADPRIDDSESHMDLFGVAVRKGPLRPEDRRQIGPALLKRAGTSSLRFAGRQYMGTADHPGMVGTLPDGE